MPSGARVAQNTVGDQYLRPPGTGTDECGPSLRMIEDDRRPLPMCQRPSDFEAIGCRSPTCAIERRPNPLPL